MVGLRHHIGGYRVIAPIGAGGFATVYRALDEATGREMAIKVLAENHSLVLDTRRRFEEEMGLLSTVRSPSIAKIYKVGETETGQPYMVLELADRGDLRRRLEEIRRSHRVLSRADLTILAEHLHESLRTLHDMEIIHRDVSPGNILIRSARPTDDTPAPRPGEGNLLEPGERLLLTDLGHAKDMILASGFTAGGGTRGFASPEQRDDVTVVDHRADIFAATAILEWAAHDGLYAEGLEPFFDVGLAEEPDDRYDSMAEWHRAFRATLADAEAKRLAALRSGANHGRLARLFRRPAPPDELDLLPPPLPPARNDTDQPVAPSVPNFRQPSKPVQPPDTPGAARVVRPPDRQGLRLIVPPPDSGGLRIVVRPPTSAPVTGFANFDARVQPVNKRPLGLDDGFDFETKSTVPDYRQKNIGHTAATGSGRSQKRGDGGGSGKELGHRLGTNGEDAGAAEVPKRQRRRLAMAAGAVVVAVAVAVGLAAEVAGPSATEAGSAASETESVPEAVPMADQDGRSGIIAPPADLLVETTTSIVQQSPNGAQADIVSPANESTVDGDLIIEGSIGALGDVDEVRITVKNLATLDYWNVDDGRFTDMRAVVPVEATEGGWSARIPAEQLTPGTYVILAWSDGEAAPSTPQDDSHRVLVR